MSGEQKVNGEHGAQESPASSVAGQPSQPRAIAPAPAAAEPARAVTPAPAAPAATAAKPAAPPAVSPKPAAPPAPPPPPAPNPLAHLPVPFEGAHFAQRGVHADATVTPDKLVDAAAVMDKEGFGLDTITGVDWLAQGQMEVVYDFYHPTQQLRAAIRTRVPRDNPEVPTISAVFPGANWHERETHDFLGIRFSGHPDLSPFLLPEDATYHPLRKDFTA